MFLVEPYLRHAGEVQTPVLPCSEDQKPKPNTSSWVSAFQDLWEFFKVYGLNPNPHRNCGYYDRHRWDLRLWGGTCIPGRNESLEAQVHPSLLHLP
jgi:hypothetical protein